MKGVVDMSCIKKWYEENIPKLSDEELLKIGYSEAEIIWLRKLFDERES